MRIKYLVIHFCALMCFSCSNTVLVGDNIQNLFDDSINLTSARLSISDSINRVSQITLTEQYLIVADPEDGFHFKAFDISNNIVNPHIKIGKIGDGPCEISRPTLLITVPNKPESIGFYNRTKFQLLINELNSISANKKSECEFYSGKIDFGFQKANFLNSTSVVGVGFFDKRFVILDLASNEIISKGGDFPHSEKNLGQIDLLPMVYQGYLAVHPTGDKFVFGTRVSTNLDIAKYENNEIISIAKFHLEETKYTGQSDGRISVNYSPENNHGFLSISVNEKYIYALHSGEKYSQSIDGSNKIYVFDWDGNPIKELNLDRTVSIISVSPDNSKIIAYFDDGKANLISYKL